MLEHTKEPLTDAVVLSFAVPLALLNDVKAFMRQKGISPFPLQHQTASAGQAPLAPTVKKESYPLEEVFPYTPTEAAAACLRGARHREDLTQIELAEKTGISRRAISEYENGKRPMGKNIAKRLGAVLGVDYRFFL